jgi:hypothetical protein
MRSFPNDMSSFPNDKGSSPNNMSSMPNSMSFRLCGIDLFSAGMKGDVSDQIGALDRQVSETVHYNKVSLSKGLCFEIKVVEETA